MRDSERAAWRADDRAALPLPSEREADRRLHARHHLRTHKHKHHHNLRKLEPEKQCACARACALRRVIVRAQHEQHKRGLLRLATLLFFVAFVCDALDAVLHVAIVLLLLAPRLLDEETAHRHHLDAHGAEHTAHEVHHAALMLALCATAAMVVGEISSARAAPPRTLAHTLLAAAKKDH